jgi:predicted Zn-dependent peptidase
MKPDIFPAVLRAILLWSLALFLLPTASPVSAQEGEDLGFPVQEHTLDNGLRLFILPRPGVPIASFVVQYRVGGVNERPGNTGIVHLLEHLFFKGTTTLGTMNYGAEAPLMEEMDRLFDSVLVLQDRHDGESPAAMGLMDSIRALERTAGRFIVSNEFDQILTENGARNLNATTSSESTNYYVELPANRAELWFVLEGDRMRNPVFREFYTEKDVVAEERRLRLDNNPAALLYEAHLGAAFQSHPYGRPVVGYMEDLERLTRREVQAYFTDYYGPNNAVVVVAGDVDPDQVLEWAQEYLGPVPRGKNPPPVRAVEPTQRGQRRVEVAMDAEPELRIGWKVPPSLHQDAPALHMLLSLLTGGRSSRMYKRLVMEERIASNVTASIEPGQLFPGLFTIQATPLRPHGSRELEAAIYEELERLKEAPPEDWELQRVRNQLEAGEVRRLRSSFGLALQLARSATLYGDWRATFDALDDLQQVTPADIQRVAARYFVREGRTVATLVRPSSGSAGSR